MRNTRNQLRYTPNDDGTRIVITQGRSQHIGVLTVTEKVDAAQLRCLARSFTEAPETERLLDELLEVLDDILKGDGTPIHDLLTHDLDPHEPNNCNICLARAHLTKLGRRPPKPEAL